MKVEDRTIHDDSAICIEIINGVALCRECLIDPQGSCPEADYVSFSSSDPREFSAHILKHISLRQPVDPRLADIALWEEALGAFPRGQVASRT